MKKRPKEPKPSTGSTTTASSKVNTSTTDNPWKSIRIDRPFPLPAFVKSALQRLHEDGHIAFVVGGSVRDFLLGKEVKDHDLATSASPDEICRLFPGAITVGKEFGVIKVPTGTEPALLEIATFRQDLDYVDHRHPRGVIFSDALQDALRRDFTINALFFDPKAVRILDATGGQEDLKNRCIRAIGDPALRFREDALRLLRAVRFQARLGFEIHPDTAEAICAKARLITHVSAERVRDELSLMWTSERPDDALRSLSDLGLLAFVLPEVEALKSSPQNWQHLFKVLKVLAKKSPQRSKVLSWAAVLHDIGKPVVATSSPGGKNYTGHEIEGARLAKSVATRLRMSREDSDRISAIVGDQLKFREVFQMREATLQRFIRQDHFEELLALHEADATVSDGNLAFHDFCSSRLQELKQNKVPVKLVDGKDLIQLGFQPGPEFSEILHELEDLALEKKFATKEEALEYVIKTYVK